ncbi:MAG: (2Fe-2S)-binding protein [Spartobacteria bacterium]|nr:(2Fe-2S)-binding protein [Spartobacteria bacterium]
MSEKKEISFWINGKKRSFDVSADEKLIDLLRREGFKSVKFGCGEATCGSCTVIMDGRAILSCVLYAFQADGRDVWTVEGVGDFDRPHPFQTALAEEGAVQCGFCIPGMVMSAKAMFDTIPVPNDEVMKEMMDGNLCRCTGYEKIWTALYKVREQNEQGNSPDSNQ